MNPAKPLTNQARALTNSAKRVAVTHEFNVRTWLTNPVTHDLIRRCYNFETNNITVEGDQKRKRRNIPWFNGNRKSLLSSLLDLWKSIGLVTMWCFIFVDGFYGINVSFSNVYCYSVGGFAIFFYPLNCSWDFFLSFPSNSPPSHFTKFIYIHLGFTVMGIYLLFSDKVRYEIDYFLKHENLFWSTGIKPC